MVIDDPHLMTLLTLGKNMKSALIAVLVALSLAACGKSANVSAVAASAAVAAPTIAEAASGVAAAASGVAGAAADVAAAAKK